tara:strand:- start:223 stop:642 length:420 start_codon:yes stop_codon:yes gene_type:complete
MTDKKEASGWEKGAVFISACALMLSIWTYYSLNSVAQDNRAQDLESRYQLFASELIKETSQGDACARNGLGGPATSQDCQYGLRTAEAIYLIKNDDILWVERVKSIVQENIDAKVLCSQYDPKFISFLKSELNIQCDNG